MRSLGHEKIETTMIYLEKVFEKEQHAIHDWNPDVFGNIYIYIEETKKVTIHYLNSNKFERVILYD